MRLQPKSQKLNVFFEAEPSLNQNFSNPDLVSSAKENKAKTKIAPSISPISSLPPAGRLFCLSGQLGQSRGQQAFNVQRVGGHLFQQGYLGVDIALGSFHQVLRLAGQVAEISIPGFRF